MKESMARMIGLVETLVQNQSQPPLLNDLEQANVLWARHMADGGDTTAEYEAVGITTMVQDEDSGGNPMHEARNSLRRQTTSVQRPVACSEGVWLPADQAGPSRPAAEGGEVPAQPSSVFERLGPLPRDTTRHVPAYAGVRIEDA